ncbi:hypothetical protein MNBD_GAMMA17-2143 [hydrothermal vent metagenome]|uniref:Uncharacterized protein n=1 Tax=hydrothermal vent metagenome TaxID=652676 RepID=A0A3B0YVB7_9ZZZZ
MRKNNRKNENVKAKDLLHYHAFDQICGAHPFKSAVPDGFVEYSVKTRHGGEVFYFNFELAQEMGLLSKGTHHSLNKKLCRKLLDTFSIEVINEYEIEHGITASHTDIRAEKYMATRYLQLQHPGRSGLTSGDGRSLWNGCFTGKGVTWDISSCGTGVTCLSPAAAHEGRNFKTGDKNASYGSGRGDLLDGVGAALMSDIFHRSKLTTERTLLLIGYPDGTSVNVRTAKNLLRPAHFFHHLKQGQYKRLKGAVDYYIERQISNGEWPMVHGKARYTAMLDHVARVFGKMVARLESDYIFCWMDWDGDNILCDGGIIDYGSLRQFGLFHHEYRYDDADRMSTSITEQKNKAKYIIQTFAQLVDYLIGGNKRPIKLFAKSPAVRLFLDVFSQTKNELLLNKIGFTDLAVQLFLRDKNNVALIEAFGRVYSAFERKKSIRGLYAVGDGVSWDAVFCMRDILRELPLWFQAGGDWMTAEHFVEIMRSDYAEESDIEISPYRRRQVRCFQRLYWQIVEKIASLTVQAEDELIGEMAQRSAVINRYERVTGDALIYVAKQLIKLNNSVSKNVLHQMFEGFVEQQVLIPGKLTPFPLPHKAGKSIPSYSGYRKLFKVIRECREGI